MAKISNSLSLSDTGGAATFVAPPEPQNTNMAWSDGTTMEWSGTPNTNMEFAG